MRTTNLLLIIIIVLSGLAEEMKGQCLKKTVLAEHVGINCVDQVASELILACDKGKILRTSDGLTWDSLNSSSVTDITSVDFTDQQNGFITTENRIYTTRNQGKTWDLIYQSVNGLNSITFNSAGTGICAGQGGILIRCSGGVQNWQSVLTGEKRNILTVTFHNTSTVYAAGEGGLFLKSEDQGLTWTSVSTGFANSFNSICSPEENTIYLASDNGLILKSTDGGLSWSVMKSEDGVDFHKILFIDKKTGYIAGNTGYAAFTNDGGETWKKLNDISGTSDISEISISDSGYLSFFTKGGEVYKSTEFLKITAAGNLELPEIKLSAISDSPVKWSCNGSGNFTPADALNTIYTPSQKDLRQGSVRFTVKTATGCEFETSREITGICKASIQSITNGNQAIFTGLTNDTASFGAYFWDFGDNTTMNGKNLTHIYSVQGNYKIRMTYRSEYGCISTDSTLIPVTSVSQVSESVSGNVWAGDHPAEKGIMYIYTKTGRNYNCYFKTQTDNGHFLFRNIPSGDYILFYLPDTASEDIKDFYATYSGDAVKWTESQTFTVNRDIIVDIHLRPDSSDRNYPEGQNTIRGKVYSSLPPRTNERISQDKKEQVEGAVITLYSLSGNRLTSVYADPYGNYNFKELNDGDYYILIEYPGAKKDSVMITVKGGHEVIKDIDVDKNKVTNLFTGLITYRPLKIYPNPAVSDIHLTASSPSSRYGNTRLKITNEKGAVLQEYNLNNKSDQDMVLDISNYPAGLYILNLENSGEIYTGIFTKN
jgi:photosystem II stability/assembly factor-like uncharacterized protein